MKNLRFILPFVAAAMIFNSCTKDEMNEPNNSATESIISTDATIDLPIGFDFDLLIDNAELLKGSKSTVPVITDDTVLTIVGSSTLHRNSNSMTFNFSAENMLNLNPAGHALTLWAIVGNHNSGPYGMYRAAGHVIGGNGKINFSGSIAEGSTKDLVVGGPLQDAENDFVVLIAKSHGPMNPMYMPAQILTFGGGCDGDPDGAGPMGPCYEFIAAGHF